MHIRRHGDLEFARLPGRLSADPLGQGVPDVSVRIVQIDPGVDRSPHRHPHSSEVAYVVSGTGYAWQDGTAGEVSSGDVVYVPRGAAHATLAVTEPLVLVCFFPHPALEQNIEEVGDVLLDPRGVAELAGRDAWLEPPGER